MSQEGTRAEAELAASLAESFNQMARQFREFGRTVAAVGAAFEAHRGRIQAAMEAEEARRIAEARELADAVAAPPAKRQPRTRPLPDWMQPSAPPMEAMVPWPTFWRDLEITPLEAVAMIREALPGALQPEDAAEERTRASFADERQWAASKLTGFTGSRAVAAQDALLQLWRKRRRQ